MVCQLPGFVVLEQPLPAQHKKIEKSGTAILQFQTGFRHRVERKYQRTHRAFEGEIVIRCAVGVGALDRILNSRECQFAQPLLATIVVMRKVHLVGERQRQHEFLIHAAGKIHRAIMPVAAIKTAVGLAVLILVHHEDQSRKRAKRLIRVPIAMPRWWLWGEDHFLRTLHHAF